MAERLKAPAWKASIRQKRIGGSNPPLSANEVFFSKKLFFLPPGFLNNLTINIQNFI